MPPWKQIVARVGSLAVGLGGSGAMVWHASNATFASHASVDTGTDAQNTIGAASGNADGLATDARGPLFNVANVTPGQSGARCTTLTSTATAPGIVRLYVQAAGTPRRDVSAYIDLTIEQGTGGSYASCDGFIPASTAFRGPLSALLMRSTFSTGLGPWALTGASSLRQLSFRFAWSCSLTATSDEQGGSTPQVSFTWRAE